MSRQAIVLTLLVIAAGIGIATALTLQTIDTVPPESVAGVSFQPPAGWSAVADPPSRILRAVGFGERFVIAPLGQPGRGMAIVGLVPAAVGRHLLSRLALGAAQAPPL